MGKWKVIAMFPEYIHCISGLSMDVISVPQSLECTDDWAPIAIFPNSLVSSLGIVQGAREGVLGRLCCS
jgi:hypothetical protein